MIEFLKKYKMMLFSFAFECILILVYLGFITFRLFNVNNSNEINTLVYIRTMIFSLVSLQVSMIVLTIGLCLVLYASYKKIAFNVKIYQVVVLFTVVLNIIIIGNYCYYNIQSKENLNLFLTEKVQDINTDKNSLSLITMNNIQKYFGCCGHDNSADYLNATETNSCYGIEVPTLPFFYFKKVYRTEPLLNSGCFQVIYYQINDSVWLSVCLYLVMLVVQIIHMFGVIRIIKKEFDTSNNILPSEQSLTVDNLLKKESQIDVQTDTN